jgi:hypothetical protein
MSTATVHPMPRPNKRLTAQETNAYRARLVALEWTQNEAARRIKKDQGLFGRWLRGELSSEPIRKRTDVVLAREEAKRANGSA